jgi:nicotinamide-nucleotide amidase
MTTTSSPAGGADELALRVIGACEARELTVGTAESVTAGLVAGCLASVPGSSRVLRGGVVAYATDVKASVLGVPEDLLAHVVSEPVSVAMAAAATRLLGADLGIATTGVAGPGWLDGQPPGTVWIAVHQASSGRSASRQLSIVGDRARVRQAAVEGALSLLMETISPVEAT